MTRVSRALPDGARELEQMVGDPSFRWHLSLNSTELSGRIDGLQVCTLSLDGRHGQLAIGGEGGSDKHTRSEMLSGGCEWPRSRHVRFERLARGRRDPEASR